MKNVLAITAVLVATAGAAAASQGDFDRFGVDVDALTPAQELTINNVIHSGASNSEIAAQVKALLKNG